MGRLEGGPLGVGLLHPVLAETALPRGQCRQNALRRVGLGDGHELYAAGVAAASPSGRRDTLTHSRQSGGNIMSGGGGFQAGLGHGSVGGSDHEASSDRPSTQRAPRRGAAVAVAGPRHRCRAPRRPRPGGRAPAARERGHLASLRCRRARRARARRLARLCRARGLVLLVAGDARLAAAVGAGGIHLREREIRRASDWRRRRPTWLITVAAHSRASLVAAHRAGADAALLAPVFATASHPGAPTLGPVRFAALACASPLPVIALGGIDARTAPRLKASGAAGLAAISGLAGGAALSSCATRNARGRS